MFSRIPQAALRCALLAGVLLTLPAAQAQTAGPGETIPLNLDEFAANLDKEYKNKCVGYAFVIFKDGWPVRQGKGGYARVASDAPQTSFNTDTRVELASCSKFVSALCVLRELETRGDVSLDSKIYKYLPSNWKIHESAKDITFKQMLAHKSGFEKHSGSTEPGKIYDAVRKELQRDLSKADKTKVVYSNLNYHLCRVVVSYMVDPAGMKALENDVKAFEKAAGQCFIERCRKQVFIPAGLNPKLGTIPWDKSVPETLHYNFKDPQEGVPNKDSMLTVGAGGWYMSARELAQICSALDRGKILTKTTYEKQKAESLGMFKVAGQYGTYHWHNGQAGEKSAHSDFMIFPNGVQVAVVTNSVGNSIDTHGDTPYRTTIKKAFDDACLMADLKVKSFANNGAVKYQGDNLTVPFKLTVENVGKGGTDIQFINALYLGDEVVWTGFMAPLAAGKSLTIEGTAKIKDKAHKHQGKDLKLKAVADARIVAGDTSVPNWANIRETEEGNNAKTATFTVPGGIGGGPGGVQGKKGG